MLFSVTTMVAPVQIKELSRAIEEATDPIEKKVLEGILNDFMDLQFGKETPYSTGATVLPIGCTIQDVDTALSKEIDPKFKAIFAKISQVFKSGDKTPQPNDGSWDPKLKPILVLVKANDI